MGKKDVTEICIDNTAMEKTCRDLLKVWCESLLHLQIKDTGNPRLDGGILCPACGRIHGRCFEAMYPFLCMAAYEKDEKWVKAAEQLFVWAEHTVSQDDGSFFNDIDSDWKGTTVFNAVQLADCLLLHEDLLSAETKEAWRRRLRRAAEFLYRFNELKYNNINYTVSNALALFECGLVFGGDRYKKKAKELADRVQPLFTKNGLLYGEGIPHKEKSPRGCRPVDIGYNVEESLPSLALYGRLSEDENALAAAEKGLEAHLAFLLENGAWDNSFGTRNYKWSYWGSRTSDGCALGYLLLADSNVDFAAAAARNLKLLKECTVDGLLAGGLHYGQAGQAPCVHHTFTHAKVLAGILDRKLCREVPSEMRLPRQREEKIRYYPEIESWIVTKGRMTGTVTAYDWEYIRGGHVGGGTLSLLHHEQAGTLLCAGMSKYTLVEPNNMQVPFGIMHECLALRIEAKVKGITYSSLYDDKVRVKMEGDEVIVRGNLRDYARNTDSERDLKYRISYQFSDDGVSIRAKFTEGTLICPVVSSSDESVSVKADGGGLYIKKGERSVWVNSDCGIALPYGTERIFNLIPGLQALRVQTRPRGGRVEMWIKVC